MTGDLAERYAAHARTGQLVAELLVRAARSRQRRLLALAAAQLARRNLPAARRTAEAVVRLDFTDARAHHLMGEILELQGEAAGARKHYLLALNLGCEEADLELAIERMRGRVG